MYVSDIDKSEIAEGEAYQLSIRHPDGSTQQLDISPRTTVTQFEGLGKRSRSAAASPVPPPASAASAAGPMPAPTTRPRAPDSGNRRDARATRAVLSSVFRPGGAHPEHRPGQGDESVAVTRTPTGPPRRCRSRRPDRIAGKPDGRWCTGLQRRNSASPLSRRKTSTLPESTSPGGRGRRSPARRHGRGGRGGPGRDGPVGAAQRLQHGPPLPG